MLDESRNERTFSDQAPLRSAHQPTYSAAPATRGVQVGRSPTERLGDARKREARSVGEVDESASRRWEIEGAPRGPFVISEHGTVRGATPPSASTTRAASSARPPGACRPSAAT